MLNVCASVWYIVEFLIYTDYSFPCTLTSYTISALELLF